jgi:putative ABC transport system substrate-binding protein
MKRTIIVLALCAVLFAPSYSASAQQAKKIPRIGYLTVQSQASSNIEALRQGLRDFGYTEGKNIIIEFRGAGGKLDRMPELAAELVSLGVDIIVTSGMPAVLAAKHATSTIPIVTANADNLVEAGVIASWARPGGNVTGSNRVDPDFSAKRLELLMETFPKLSRVAVLSHGSLGGDKEERTETQARARSLGIQIQSFQVQDPNTFMGAFAEMAKRRAEALIIFTSSFTGFYRTELLELATKNRLPTMCGSFVWTDGGCFMSYGSNPRELHQRAAYFVDKILTGTKPADLPVERPRKYELIINLKTAKQIGLTIPPNVLARADKVIR